MSKVIRINSEIMSAVVIKELFDAAFYAYKQTNNYDEKTELDIVMYQLDIAYIEKTGKSLVFCDT